MKVGGCRAGSTRLSWVHWASPLGPPGRPPGLQSMLFLHSDGQAPWAPWAAPRAACPRMGLPLSKLSKVLFSKLLISCASIFFSSMSIFYLTLPFEWPFFIWACLIFESSLVSALLYQKLKHVIKFGQTLKNICISQACLIKHVFDA